MATTHFCNGKWRDGPVSACPKHKGLSKKQPSVYRTPDSEGGGDSSSKGESSSGGSAEGSGSSSS